MAEKKSYLCDAGWAYIADVHIHAVVVTITTLFFLYKKQYLEQVKYVISMLQWHIQETFAKWVLVKS